jgi:tRNA threonylcarbamoyladenosine biosynthesis protein TsaB
MIVTLAIDAATDTGSVAAERAGQVPAVVTFGSRRHAAELVPAIGTVLRRLNAGYGDIARIILADGPASFTGLRIGFATALGLVQTHRDIAVSVAPSLMAAAWTGSQAAAGAPVAAVYDALRGDVYAAIYRFQAETVEVLLPPVCTTVAALLERPGVKPVLAVGDGAQLYADLVQRWTGRAPLVPGDGVAGATALLRLLGLRGGVVTVPDLTQFNPTYGRPAEAQARWEQRHGRALPHS